MTRRGQVIALAVLGVLVAGGLALRVALGGAPTPTHAVIVVDRSDSTRDICAAVLGVAEGLLSERPWPKGSSLALLATGDDDSLGEPIELYRYLDFRRAKTVEGKSGGARRVRELLAGMADACARAPRTRTSPIYLAVRRGAEMLSASPCASERCTLAVVSDGEETAEPGLVAALRGGSRGKLRTSPPPAIPNETARVRFCGLAETAAPPPKAHARGRRPAEPRRDALRADRLSALWRAAFSRPDGVVLSPICPKRQPEASP